jgi:hypothetical protein
MEEEIKDRPQERERRNVRREERETERVERNDQARLVVLRD